MSNGDVKIYVITFGVQGVNLGALNQYLYDSNDVIAFWNYVPLVYCIKSTLSATEITIKLRPFFPFGTYFVAEINKHNMNGSLPQPAWEWFYLDHHQKHQPPALTAGLGLAGVLGATSQLGPTSGLAGALSGFLAPPSNKK